MLNSPYYVIASIVACVWLIGWGMMAVWRLRRSDAASIYWVVLVHVFFSGLPLITDLVIGRPTFTDFTLYRGFVLSSTDALTNYIYLVYVCLVPVLLVLVGVPKRSPQRHPDPHHEDMAPRKGRVRLIPLLLLPVLFLPVVMLALAPNPAIYLNYAVTVTQTLSANEGSHHALISLGARASIIAAAGILLFSRKITLLLLASVLPWVGFAIWLDGKRNIVVIAIMMLAYVLWTRGILNGARLYATGAVVAVLMVGYSVVYAGSIRQWDSDRQYEVARIDYGRDTQIRMTLFAELNPDQMQVLNYRGESLLFYLGMYIPRDVWPEKPLPYAQMYTSALFLTEPRFWGWSMTTSWLEEAIANFSWFGIVIGPMVPALVCRWSDSKGSDIAKALGVLVAMLLLAVHLVAFAPIALMWLGLMLKPGLSWGHNLAARSRLPRALGASQGVPGFRGRVANMEQYSYDD